MHPLRTPHSFALALALSLVLAPLADVSAGTGDSFPVEHRLLLGSVLQDDCLDCDRPVVPEGISGSFTLTFVDTSPLDFRVFDVSDVEFRTPPAPGSGRVIGGRGSYRIDTKLDQHQLLLDLEISDHGNVTLTSPFVKRTEQIGTIDITVKEDGTRDPLHVFSIRIIAAPLPVDPVPYELVAGSKVLIDCFVCELVAPERPIEGSFLLEKTSADANPVASFRIWDLAFRSDDGSLEGVGDGVYTQGGEVALLQSIDLHARWVDDTLPVQLESGQVQVPVALPAIDIQAPRDDRDPPPGGPIFIRGLRIVARPSSVTVEYRRGDANADGDSNISDAVYVLLWSFAGGETPSCLDAADTNDDEKHDITDAVFLLNYLFQGGAAPPIPGAGACGTAPAPNLGCTAYTAC